MTPDYCPNCGEAVPEKAKACPHCGACEKTGWSEDAEADRLGIPSGNFDYGEFVKEEFGARKAPRRKEVFILIVAVILLLAFALGILR